VNKNPIKNLDSKLTDILKKWLVNGYITKQKYHLVKISDALLPKPYGLPEIYKRKKRSS